jgi:hypothetical protein
MLYRVEALEKFIVRTVYYVDSEDAKTPFEAEQLCRMGYVAYDESSIEEGDAGDEEWLETVSISKEDGCADCDDEVGPAISSRRFGNEPYEHEA